MFFSIFVLFFDILLISLCFCDIVHLKGLSHGKRDAPTENSAAASTVALLIFGGAIIQNVVLFNSRGERAKRIECDPRRIIQNRAFCKRGKLRRE